jgi:phosphoribosylformylglycinamidine cyclo-ligase
VELLKSKVKKTTRPEVMGDLGGFSGLFRLNAQKYKSPILASSTDGVGTKLVIAQQLDIHDTIGIDLVAMVVDDLVACGAEPLFLLDYIACGEVVPDKVAEIGAGIADGCRYAGCALLGGETAELPGLYAPGHFDLAGFACGAVERDEALGPARVREGDLIVGLPSSGLHANGYSLVRSLVAEGALAPDPDLLLAPTRLYPGDLAALREAGVPVAAAAHITGGGLPENLPRAVPDGLRPVVEAGGWTRPPAVEAVLATGRVSDEEAWRTFNMGLGMCLVLAPEDAPRALDVLPGARVVGRIERGPAGLARA